MELFSGESTCFYLCYRSQTSNGANNVERPVWSNINDAIAEVLHDGGMVKLYKFPQDSGYVKFLEMISLKTKFKILATTNDDNYYYRIREWWDPTEPPFSGVTLIGDDEFDNRTFCTDSNVAYELFEEFYTTEELREGLKNMLQRDLVAKKSSANRVKGGEQET
ncbi:DUF6911 family protein [Pokkaliibacter sp. CJK22405]|uniref:DUF6911 family protein n=1 Tax=Pokkaliibacter sp. CJK22405 TaxID=3384615 RepID=UPI0039855801